MRIWGSGKEEDGSSYESRGGIRKAGRMEERKEGRKKERKRKKRNKWDKKWEVVETTNHQSDHLVSFYYW